MDHRNDDVLGDFSSSKLADYSMRSSLLLRDSLEARCPRGDASCIYITISSNIFLGPALSLHVFLTIIVEAECYILGG